MRICIPVECADGMASRICDRFADAPCLLIFDPDDGSLAVVEDWHKARSRGMCEPVRELLDRNVEQVVSRGMGLHGIEMLAAHGIRVLRTDAVTAGDAVKSLAGQRPGGTETMDTCLCQARPEPSAS